MRSFCTFAVLSAAMLLGVATAANADSAKPADFAATGAQIAALPPGAEAPASMTLPAVTVHPPTHFKVWAGYDADVALHPYTSGLGPCAEGSTPSQGCHHPTGTPIPPSYYERPPFTD